MKNTHANQLAARALADLGFTEADLGAAAEYTARRDRRSHPAGAFDGAGRWFPAGVDAAALDRSNLREPSRAFPLSFNKACRSAEHVARLYSASPLSVKRLVRFPALFDGSASAHETLAAVHALVDLHLPQRRPVERAAASTPTP